MADNDGLRALETMAEDAYDRMYDARSRTAAAACYSDAKEALFDAVAFARELGNEAAVKRLQARLAHIKGVYRSQFS